MQLKMMIERLLWFNERLEDEKIDWYCEPHFYSSFKYMVASSHIVPERTVLFHEAENIMNKICEKYNMDMPLIRAVQEVVLNGADPREIVTDLMGRKFKQESI